MKQKSSSQNSVSTPRRVYVYFRLISKRAAVKGSHSNKSPNHQLRADAEQVPKRVGRRQPFVAVPTANPHRLRLLFHAVIIA